MAPTRSTYAGRRRHLWRRPAFRRAGVWLGVLALLIQSAIFAAHHPSQAGNPFGSDPSVWCLASGHLPDGGATTNDSGKKSPLDAAANCPICQAAQHATKLLPVIAVAIAAPLQAPIFVETPFAGTPPSPPAITKLNPRAPPAFA